MLAGLLVYSGVRAADTVDVQVEGLETELEENVRAFLSIVERSEPQDEEDEEAAPLNEAAIRRLHRRAPEEIRKALQPFGYYSPAIETNLEGGDGSWRATYAVDPGAPTRLAQVEIRVEGEARDLPDVKSLLADADIEPGDVLSHPAYERVKNGLLEAVYSAGYLDAAWRRSEMLVEPDRRRARIFLVLESGRRYYFGDIRIEQDILNQDFVERYNDIEPGEPFDTDRLIDLQLDLSSSDYFSAVDVQAHRDEAADFRVPVTIRTEPRKPQHYTFGVGYGTDTGARVSFGTEFRRINRRGHQFRLDVQLSEIRNAFTAQYHVPIENVVTDRMTYFSSLQQVEIGDADSDLFSVGATREENWRGLRRRLYLRFDRENYMFGGQPGDSASLLYPGINITWQRADDPLFPRRGLSVSFDLHGSVENPLSETTFVQSTLGARAVLPLGERGRLLLRGEAGATRAANFFRSLPPSQRFFTGGDRTVRGYGYQELSPQDDAGNDVGGQYMAAGSVEVDYLVKGNFGLAAFFDSGNAASTPDADLLNSVGLGLRYRSPVGMIRLDVAHPLDDPDTDFRIHISLGPDL